MTINIPSFLSFFFLLYWSYQIPLEEYRINKFRSNDLGFIFETCFLFQWDNVSPLKNIYEMTRWEINRLSTTLPLGQQHFQVFFIYKTAVDVVTIVAAVAVAVVVETVDHIEVPVYNQWVTVVWKSAPMTRTVAAAVAAVVARRTLEQDAAAVDSTVATAVIPAAAHCNRRN